jgi:hypothetical protein
VSTDTALLDAADAYVDAGHRVHQEIARGDLSGDSASDYSAGDLAELGNTLLGMGRQLRRVVAAVHRLGGALDVE